MNLINGQIEIYKCFKEVNGKRQICDILVIKKDNEQLYYIFNNENQEFQSVKIEDLLDKTIYFHDAKHDRLNIKYLIKKREILPLDKNG